MIGLDTSIIPDYSDSQFTDELKSKLTNILSKSFAGNTQKQSIKKEPNGFNIACPYCGDSATDSRKKRGHLSMKGKYAGFYKCYNCNKFCSIPKFFQDFENGLSVSGIKYVSEHKNDFQPTFDNSSEITADIFKKTLALQYGIEKNYFRQLLGLYEINSPIAQNAKNYLLSRMQYNFNKFLYDAQNNYIIILNLCDDKVIGFQMRSLNPDTPKDRRFLTFNMSRMYKKILKSNITPPEELDKVSSLFGIYNIDVYKPIIVVEGPMDSFLLPNAIATAGATKSLTVELPFWYMFDSDETGNKYAETKLLERQKVFMWEKFKRAYNLPNRKKWDCNDVVLYLNSVGITKIDWLKYFSDSPGDMLNIKMPAMRL